jgi:LmbE family N-acetylglucosaminyl deacetylase
MAHTLVCFHAHPDDEALLTAGVMARAAADGHRVVLVVATRGDAGQVADAFLARGEELGDRRWVELERSAELLGVDRLAWLGYADSGDQAVISATPGAGPAAGGTIPFVAVDVEEAATRLAQILREEAADVLTTYDPNGGYGHPDHVQVHRVGARAGVLAATPVVLEATINRDLMRTGLELATSLGYELPPDFSPDSFDAWYTPADELTHAVDVRAHLDAKRQAMEAHASQATAADVSATRSLAVFVTLPPEYFELAFGTEWFVDRSQPAGGHRAPWVDDIFATLPGPR